MLAAELIIPERLVNIYSIANGGGDCSHKVKPKPIKTSSVTFRIEGEEFQKLQQEAHKQRISLNSLINHLTKNYFEWHIFEQKVGFVTILKPVVRELYTQK